MSSDHGPLNRSAIAAAVAAAVVLSIPVAILVLYIQLLTGGFTDDDRIRAALRHPGYLTTVFCLWLLPTALGGFVAGKIAKQNPIRHATWVGAVILVIYAISTLVTAMYEHNLREPLWFELVSLAVVVPVARAGGQHSIPRGARQGRY